MSNTLPRTWSVVVAILVVLGVASAAGADEADVFFDDSYVHEVRIYFDDPDWYNTLYNSHDTDPEDPYFPARFEYGDIVLDPVGVRFKGYSSFTIPTVKKSFKIDFDEYDEGNDALRFLGLKKLNLNNSFMDPTMLREKLFLGFAGQYVPAMRAVHSRLYVNDVYWGLYTAVEQIDKTFAQSRFGSDEDGNLFKTVEFADLTYLGAAPEPYYEHYALKTNETENDWSGLIEFIDILNNALPADLPAQIEPVFDVPSGLLSLALDNLFVNLDSYCGSAHNYYLYDRDDTGRFTHLHWDTNMAFGTFRMMLPPWVDVLTRDPLWLPLPPPGAPPTERPLMENLWAVEAYEKTYLRDLAQMLREGFDVATMEQRINELADIIRADVYADPNKMYSDAEFEQNLYYNIGSGPQVIHGLRYFVEQRTAYLDSELDTYAEQTDLRLNELMTVNTGTIQDGAGDYDPWVEIYNVGPGIVSLSGLYLTDDNGDPTKWALPPGNLDDGEFLTLWVDGETGEGADHANFSLQAGGENLYLYQSGITLIDSVLYPSLVADESFARLPDGDGGWETTDQPTPGAANLPATEPVELYINEFMADNDTTIQDPDGTGYPDWIELYNAGTTVIDIGGMYLTDDLADPTQYLIPVGVSISAGGYLLFWADNDPEQGDTHTNFKLGKDGEEIGLYDTDAHGNAAIDTLTFVEQGEDVSMGRFPDGADCWRFFTSATPEFSNGIPHDYEPDGDVDIDDYAEFAACLTGPDSAAVRGCEVFDSDCDGNVNCDDWLLFCNAWTGPPAEPPVLPECDEAKLIDSSPAHEVSLWRTANNVIRLTFDTDITAPADGELLIEVMNSNGAFGTSYTIAVDTSEDFVVEVVNDGNGDPRILDIWENEAVLTHKDWIAVYNVGGWTGVANFHRHYPVMKGDVNGDGDVLPTDFGPMFPKIPTFGSAPDERADVNGDRDVLPTDFGPMFPQIPTFGADYPKPNGH